MRKILFLILNLMTVGAFAREACLEKTFFEDFKGSQLNTAMWSYQNGNGCEYGNCGWGNNEQQYYRPQNARVENDHLVITATRDKDGKIYSTKIITQGNFSQQYGRFEARIKVPDGRGLWPAFWLMPDETDLTWPLAGEIDILERPARSDEDLHTLIGAAHFGELWPGNTHFATFLRMPKPWHEDFHIYRLDWTPEKITWQVDDKVFAILNRSDVEDYRWPFENHPFYIILNMAVGGTLGGEVFEQSFPAEMMIDYVRVSQFTSCQ